MEIVAPADGRACSSTRCLDVRRHSTLIDRNLTAASMTALGLARVETPGRLAYKVGRCEVLATPDRGHKRPDAHHVHDAGEIVDEFV